MKYDFSGYATRNNIKCSDGRVIMRDAFKDNDHKNVPLVWQHDHMSPDNVLGHAMLENREDGVYAYGCFNDTPSGLNAKELVKNGDVRALSIYANKLKQNGANVIHGAIREVSLVLAGANPGAYIDTVMVHSDGDEETEDAEICFNLNTNPILYHSDDEKNDPNKKDNPDKDDKKDEHMSDSKIDQGNNSNKTVQDVINSMTEEQKNVLYTLVGMAADGSLDDEGDDDMKHNAFEDEDDYMAHSVDFSEIIRDAKRCGSLREAVIEHGLEDVSYEDYLEHGKPTYGIDQIDTLFPDFKNINSTPEWVSRNMDWVAGVMNGVSHTPFSRIKSVFANITADEARARGYTKGKKKLEEVFTLLKRTTTPQTIYKKQKLDRDDVIDITDFDVVAWLKGEMRMMLDEEIARAILIGDGRSDSSDDRIFPTNIRPIWQDDTFYTIRAQVDTKGMNEDAKTEAVIKAIIRARKNYKGSGNPVFYTTEDTLTDMLLLENQIGDVKYKTKQELANRLRVSDIVTVEVMEGQTRKGDVSKGDVTASATKDLNLVGLIVNLKDYNVGADKGGAVSMFDDFDIDYNQQKYLIETRCSGALIKPYAAISVETFDSSVAV